MRAVAQGLAQRAGGHSAVVASGNVSARGIFLAMGQVGFSTLANQAHRSRFARGGAPALATRVSGVASLLVASVVGLGGFCLVGCGLRLVRGGLAPTGRCSGLAGRCAVRVLISRRPAA